MPRQSRVDVGDEIYHEELGTATISQNQKQW